ncbi:MAG TPA: sigma-70 family RNA polymerase sigma factor [Chloroflexota bacterium]|nr:sigma-70 family RNA polymerase sigma factor [Chloroflexota bacterium]
MDQTVLESLVRRAQTGDVEALARLVDTHYALLLRFCRRLAREEGHAQDLAQETLLRALQVIGRLEDPARFPAWLCGIAVNLAHKWRRRQARWPQSLERLGAALAEQGVGEPFGVTPWHMVPKSAEQLVEDAEQAQRVLDAIAGLPAPLRRVVVLYYLEDLSYREMAAALDLPISTIKWRLFTSRLQLRRTLQETREEPTTMTSLPSETPPAQPPLPPQPPVAEQLARLVVSRHQQLAQWHGAMARQRSLTAGTLQAFAVAEKEAAQLGHDYLGTEHILLGLLREPRDAEDVAARVLTEMGVTAPKVREIISARIGRGGATGAQPPLLAPRARNTLLQGIEDARRLGHDHLGTEHVLLGLVREGTGMGALIVESLGVDLDQVRSELLRRLASSP